MANVVSNTTADTFAIVHMDMWAETSTEVHVRCWQPMDLGVLRQFKCKYCSHLLQSLLANAETCEHAYKFSSRITVLDAVRWISQSWNPVDAEVIIKCFQLSGISSAEDPITEQDDSVVCISELAALHKAVSERHLVTDDVINAQDYAAIDDELILLVLMNTSFISGEFQKATKNTSIVQYLIDKAYRCDFFLEKTAMFERIR
ncbi:hypothetical protein D917_07201 [Trichinella nativa]|uniref:DDE-1 domain-containing protein n=1 Tax=Trichinella nativa TaxID=6335 RepID=A0A1Y3EQA6_9BILA|nr:hypothetical protein D917_07201 [Trichinella nativa]